MRLLPRAWRQRTHLGGDVARHEEAGMGTDEFLGRGRLHVRTPQRGARASIGVGCRARDARQDWKRRPRRGRTRPRWQLSVALGLPSTTGGRRSAYLTRRGLIGVRPLLQAQREEVTRPAEYGHDFRHGRLTPIDDSKVARHDLAQIRRLALGHDAARVRKRVKAFDCSHQSSNGQVSPSRRINLNEGADLFEICFGARGPQDVDHRPRRRLTSS